MRSGGGILRVMSLSFLPFLPNLLVFFQCSFCVLSVSVRGIICILILSGDRKCIFKYIDMMVRENDELNEIPEARRGDMINVIKT